MDNQQTGGMQTRKLCLVSAAHFITDINIGSLPAVLPFFITAYGFDYKAAAGLMFASSFLSTFVQPLFGWLADRGNRQWFMGLGILLCGLSFGLTGFVSNYWVIFAAVTLSGIGSAIFHPQAAKIVNAISGTKRGTGMSFFSVGGNAGFGVGPLLGVGLVTLFGMKGLGFYAAVSGAVGLLMLLFAKSFRVAVPAGSRSAAQAAADARNDWPAFGKLTAFIICRSVAYVCMNSFLPLFCIYALGTSNAVAGSTISIIAISGIFCTMLSGPLADRFGYVRMIRIGSLALVPVFALAFLPHSLFWVYAMLVPISMAFNATYTPFVVLGQTYLSRSIGFASGVTLGISFSAGGIIAPAIGAFGDAYGISSVMALLVGIAAVSAAIAFMLPKREGG